MSDAKDWAVETGTNAAKNASKYATKKAGEAATSAVNTAKGAATVIGDAVTGGGLDDEEKKDYKDG